MSIKAKAPEEDPETKARREAAEKRADAGRIDETRDFLSRETRSILRQFGKTQGGSLATAGGGAGGLGGLAGFGGFIPSGSYGGGGYAPASLRDFQALQVQ